MTLSCSLTPVQRLVLLALASHGGPRSKGLYPSISRLAAETGFCRRTVQMALQDLEQLGVLRIHRRAQASHRYELLLDQLQTALSPSEAVTLAAEPGCAEPSFTLAEMQAAMAFVAEAGRESELQLVPELLLPSDAQALPAVSSVPPTSSLSVSATPLRVSPPVQGVHPEAAILLPPHTPPVQQVRTPSSAASSVGAAPAQPLPLGVHALQARGAATAPEPVSENLSRNIDIQKAEKRAHALLPPDVDRQGSRGEGPLSLDGEAPSVSKVEALWNDAWSARYRSAYTAERGDGARFAFLAKTASGKARTRQLALRSRGEPTPGLGNLAEQYLTHLFGAYLAEPGQPTREGPGFLRWKKHPLRYLESDLARLGDPWAQLDRQQAAATQAPSAVQGARAITPTRVPRVLVPSPATVIPPEAMATLGALLGRHPVVHAPAEIRPPSTAEQARQMLGPEATEEEVAACVRADQRRWAYQQRKANDQRKAG